MEDSIGAPKAIVDAVLEVPQTFVIDGDIEIGFGNKIPLWLFGFLY